METSTSSAVNDSVLNRTATGTFKILCLSYEGRKLGAACYEEYGQTIYYLRDTADDENFNTLRFLIDCLKPTHVIANASSNKQFRATLQTILKCNLEDLTLTMGEKTMDNMDKTTFGEDTQPVPTFQPHVTLSSQSMQRTDDDGLGILRVRTVNVVDTTQKEDEATDNWFASLQLMPRSCFSVEEGTKWLKRILSYDNRNADLRAKLMFDVGEVNMMSALGALLRHVNQLQIGLDVDPNSIVVVSTFKQITLGDVIDVDIGTVKALEIFECQNDFMGSNMGRKYAVGKRGNQPESLFDFCNMCRSTAGKRKLMAWFARPIRTREILKLRHDGVSFFNQDCNMKFTQYIRSKIRHISMLNGVVSRMRLGKSPVSDWKNLLKTMDSLIKVGDALREYEVKMPILGYGEKALGTELARIHTLIKETFDADQSTNEERFVVKPGISEELDELKATYDELADCLTEVAQHEIYTYNFNTCSVCYLPIIGYLVLVPTASMENLDETDIEMVYSTDQSIGFKTPRMHELDQKYGDIRSKIIDNETLISNSLQELIIKRRKVIFDGIEVASTLDCLISLALVAHEQDWCRPVFSDDPILDVNNGRHPIAERVCKGRYVPNPIKSGDPRFGLNSSKVKLITGPNASGKSVYLKMVGTMIYLAHVGSFVPADRAVFGPINRLISRMYSIDTVLNGLSSFGNDIKQMSDAICKADTNSVIIIDEFGKGTMTEVGLSLLASCLNYWLDSEKNCPHIFVSTHFHSLPNLLHQSRLLSNNLMRVLNEDDGELIFTYEFVDGYCTHSYANFTALKMGVKKSVIERAEEIGAILKDGKSLIDIPSANQEDERRMAELAARMETLVDDFCNWDMRADPKTFLDKAKAALIPSQE